MATDDNLTENENINNWFIDQRLARQNELAQLRIESQSQEQTFNDRKAVFERFLTTQPAGTQQNLDTRETQTPRNSSNSSNQRREVITTSSYGNSNQSVNQTTLTISPQELEDNSANVQENVTAFSEIDQELSNLVRSQLVSSVLTNVQFRDSLERRLRSSLNNVSSSQSNSTTVTNATAPTQTDTNVNLDEMLNLNNDPEISALVNYQVVSNILQSAFRSHLENTLWTRYVQRHSGTQDSQGDNLANVQHETLSRSNTLLASSDNELPRGHRGNNELRLLYTMRNEISDLRSMMNILMQSQIETQRFIRTEVASVMKSFNDAGASNRLELCVSQQKLGSCCICLNSEADTMIYKCGHICLCYPCSSQLRIQAQSRTILCPVCRTPAQDIVKVFSPSTTDTPGQQTNPS